MKKQLLLLFFVFLVSFFLAIDKGAVSVNIFHLTPLQRDILLSVRIPRVILAAGVGACLVVAGILFQYVLQNPLADSFTTGASSCAALGAVVALVIGLRFMIFPFALIFSLLGLLVVYKISSVKGKVIPITVLLAGIVLSTFSSASISLIKFVAQDSITSIVFWLMGGFQNATPFQDLLVFLILFVVVFRLSQLFPAIDIISFDDFTAISSGVDVYRLRKELMFYGALLTAVSVAFSGVIGFVGLIVPHILRLLKLIKARQIVFCGVLAGASFMIIADLLSRVLLSSGEELPVGVLTSTIGGGFFLYLLIQRKKSIDQWEV